VLRKHQIRGLILDAGCGTGTVAWKLARRGFDMIGVDISEAMLSQAQNKVSRLRRRPVLFLKQDLCELDLFGTVRAVLCLQDTLNHLGGGLEQALKRISLFLEQGGIFIFDINTQYKHEKVLAESFCFPIPGGLVVWKSSYEAELGRVKICLSLSTEEDTQVVEFYEYDIAQQQLLTLLAQNGLEVLEVLDGESYRERHAETQRELYITRKIGAR